MSLSKKLSLKKLRFYIISNANTKKVVIKGRIKVSHGQCVNMAKQRAMVDTKNNNQYKPLFLFLSSMRMNFGKNKPALSMMNHFLPD